MAPLSGSLPARSSRGEGEALGGLPAAIGLPAGTIPVFLRLRQLTQQHLSQKTTGLQAFITHSVAAAALPPDLANPDPDLLARQGDTSGLSQ